MLGVEPNYLIYLDVSPHWTPVCNRVATLPVFWPPWGSKGVGGGWEGDLMSAPLAWIWGQHHRS